MYSVYLATKINILLLSSPTTSLWRISIFFFAACSCLWLVLYRLSCKGSFFSLSKIRQKLYLSAKLGKGRIPRWQRSVFYLKLCCVDKTMNVYFVIYFSDHSLSLKHMLTTHKYIQKANTSYSGLSDGGVRFFLGGKASFAFIYVTKFSFNVFPY